ncbi:carbonic anhydrase [Nonomuraea soli]|uniref:Carbonic anhydrase n=1 Tax=Nonomuraea soli TaxID=1032476 RepID=A0A7W0HUE6_9ACTN|nr:carbonic anhydrase [Nonomuraea soli]MBA2896020.1 carbonic anhydrase [Nonomuraea soli]
MGDLMVVRTAAHTLDPLVKAAVEYGPQHLGVPLVVVLGHQRCGAVTAAREAIRDGRRLHGDLQRVVDELLPSYRGDVTGMIQAHTRACVRRLGGLGVTVIGAYYSLDTGVVRRI